ncbi:MAG TPA: GNAT family N-acetyltransferase [Candidatus Entotheonella sp.]|jgi:hypothetical protein
MSIQVYRPSITLIDQPSGMQLLEFWEVFSEDSTTRGAYLDPRPHSLDDFLAPVMAGATHLWLVEADGDIAGAHWLHDMHLCDAHRSGWMAGYFFPAYRGVLGPTSLQQTHEAVNVLGVHHIFCAIRHGNIASVKFVEKAGYHYISTFPNFGRFEGQADAVDLFSLQHDDASMLLEQSRERSRRHWEDPQLS